MKSLAHLTVCWSLVLPLPAWGAVTISEIAWMGSAESANYEWIELHNTGDTAVDLTGWQLRDANTLTIDLAGTVSAGEYVVVERNRGSEDYLFTPPFLVYTGALINSGTTLTLYYADGTIADQVAGGENWESIGGDNTTKETAQYTTAGWVTAPPTPGAATTASTRTSATNPTSTTNPAPSTTTTGANQRSPATTSGGGEARQLVEQPSRLALQITAPTTAYVGQPAPLSVSASGVPKVIADSLKYQWNFGDTHTSVRDEVEHVYDFPGQYVVTVEATYAQQAATARHTITVLPVTVSVARSEKGDLHIHNDAPYEIDISGYRLVGDSRVVFPARSLVLPNSTVTVAWSRLAHSPATVVALYDQAGSLVTHTQSASTPVPATPARAVVAPRASVPIERTVSVAPSLAPPALASSARDFTFATAAAAPATTETPVVTRATTTRPAASSAAEYRPSTTSVAAAPVGRSNDERPDWWTTGGLIILLSGTILGLWWQRRFV